MSRLARVVATTGLISIFLFKVVPASAQVDTTPPTIHAVWSEPETVASGDSFAIHVEVTDDLSGISSIAVNGSSPTDIHGFGAGISDVSGDIWSGTIDIPAQAEPGTWSIDVYAHDVAGNEASRHDAASLVVSTDEESGGSDTEMDHRWVAFYGVPDDSNAYALVDPCWTGAHITLAAFEQYPNPGPDSPGVEGPTYQDALSAPEKIARTLDLCSDPDAIEWRMNNPSNAKWMHPPDESKEDPIAQDLKLELLSPNDHPSATFEKVLDELQHPGNVLGVHEAKDLHVTFDQCSCYHGNSGVCDPGEVFNEWGVNTAGVGWESRINWKVIPVEYIGTDARPPHAPEVRRGDCETPNPSHEGGRMNCSEAVPLQWHTNRSVVVNCTLPEPDALNLSLVSLFALLLLRRATRGSTRAPRRTDAYLHDSPLTDRP